MKRAKKLQGLGVAGLLAAGSIFASGALTAAPAAASSCVSAKNIEAIVDDSGSMSITDKNRLRVQAMNLLIDTLSPTTQLGAVEFGSGLLSQPAADTVFAPAAVGPNAHAMSSALNKAIQADNGATDYNGAFAQSDADNPGADARIFLTDGGHDIGTYNDAHLVHKVPTYVIGFGTGVTAVVDQQRLKKIANDTGGKYFSLSNAGQLQSVMNSVGAALTCQTPPRQFTDALRQGAAKTHSIAIGARTKTLQIALTWASPLDKFKISGLRLVGSHGLLAVASRRPARLKVKKTVSSTFVILRVSKLHQGRLHFKVAATKVGAGSKATLTTQIGQSRHR